MLANEKIFKRYFQEDEKILWSSKPFARRYPIIDDTKIRYLFNIILAIIVGIIITFLVSDNPLDLSKSFTTYLIFIFLCFALINIVFIFILIFGGIDRQMLQNTEYFITNKQIFSIKLRKVFFKKYKEIVNLPLNGIEYYFIRLTKSKPKPIYDIYFKTKMNSLDNWQNTILKCKEMKDYKLKEKFPIMITRDEGWKATSLETIEKMKNAVDIEKFNVILNGELGIKIQDPPREWKKKRFGGEFHNPY